MFIIVARNYEHYPSIPFLDYADYADKITECCQVSYEDHSTGMWYYVAEATPNNDAIIYRGTWGNDNSPGANDYTFADVYDMDNEKDKEEYCKRVQELERLPEWREVEEEEENEEEEDQDTEEVDPSREDVVLHSYPVEKSYYHRRHADNKRTIEGVLRIALDLDAVRSMMIKREISSCDERIEWEEEVNDQWIYEDFSFQLIEQDDE